MSKIRFIIYRSDLKNLQTRQKKLKNANQFVSVGISKRNHKSYLSLATCHKYVVQFTEPIPIIYLYAIKTKLTFLNMPVLNTVQ